MQCFSLTSYSILCKNGLLSISMHYCVFVIQIAEFLVPQLVLFSLIVHMKLSLILSLMCSDIHIWMCPYTGAHIHETHMILEHKLIWSFKKFSVKIFLSLHQRMIFLILYQCFYADTFCSLWGVHNSDKSCVIYPCGGTDKKVWEYDKKKFLYSTLYYITFSIMLNISFDFSFLFNYLIIILIFTLKSEQFYLGIALQNQSVRWLK